MSHRVIESPCPYCGKELDAATNSTGNEGPRLNDVTVCTYCFEVVVFGDGLALRKPTEPEMIEINDNRGIIDRAIKAAKEFRRLANASKN